MGARRPSEVGALEHACRIRSTRKRPKGSSVEDIDGDGRILQMRIEDAERALEGASASSRGLMVRRDPTETGGTYYRVMPEGRYDDYDGYTLKVKRPRQGLDLNRNFPASWRQEFEQLGAGPYPTSEPEIRAVVDFIVRHPNITGGTTFHTWSGVLLRPFEHLSDDEMDAEDLWFYQAAGRKGTELTGYPAISVYHEFRYHPKSVIGGTFDWIYEHLGLFSWVVEIWSPMREAGITELQVHRLVPRSSDRRRPQALSAGARTSSAVPRTGRGSRSSIRSSARSRSAAGTGSTRSAIRRCRCSSASSRGFRAGCCGRRCARRSSSSCMRARARSATDTWKVTLVIQNTGWLPTYVSKRALARKTVRGIMAEIELPAGASLATGKARDDVGQLEGKAYKHTGVSFWPDYNVTDDRMKVEWVVRGEAGRDRRRRRRGTSARARCARASRSAKPTA